jgi:hypothetical protein
MTVMLNAVLISTLNVGEWLASLHRKRTFITHYMGIRVDSSHSGHGGEKKNPNNSAET